MLGMLLKKIFAKYRCYNKLQLIEFDVIYDVNNRQLLIELKSKRSYSKDLNAVSVAKKVNIMYRNKLLIVL